MTNHRQLVLVAALLCILLFAIVVSGAEAQDVAPSFEELRVLVEVGDTVSITDTLGSEVTGRIDVLTPSVIGLQVAGRRREFQEGQVNTIRQGRFDSLLNGALWGLAIGGVSGLLLEATAGSNERAGVVVYPVLFGGVGSLIGTGVDAFQREQQTIYARPSDRVSFAPILASERVGVRFLLRF